MGSFSRMNRCNRFIEEFGDTAKEKFKIAFPAELVESYGLGQHEGWDQVFMYWTLIAEDEEEYLMMLDAPVFFDPESMDDDTIERTMRVFDMPRQEVVRRLRKANLIEEDSA